MYQGSEYVLKDMPYTVFSERQQGKFLQKRTVTELIFDSSKVTIDDMSKYIVDRHSAERAAPHIMPKLSRSGVKATEHGVRVHHHRATAVAHDVHLKRRETRLTAVVDRQQHLEEGEHLIKRCRPALDSTRRELAFSQRLRSCTTNPCICCRKHPPELASDTAGLPGCEEVAPLSLLEAP